MRLCDKDGIGSVPVERFLTGNPIAYLTKEAAERRIAECAIDRMQQFLTGKVRFEDAVAISEFVVEVDVLSDGSIVDQEENHFGKDNW